MPCSLQTQIAGNKVSLCTLKGPFGDAVATLKASICIVSFQILTSLFKGVEQLGLTIVRAGQGLFWVPLNFGISDAPYCRQKNT